MACCCRPVVNACGRLSPSLPPATRLLPTLTMQAYTPGVHTVCIINSGVADLSRIVVFSACLALLNCPRAERRVIRDASGCASVVHRCRHTGNLAPTGSTGHKPDVQSSPRPRQQDKPHRGYAVPVRRAMPAASSPSMRCADTQPSDLYR